jgi:hypothetical protein
MSLPCIDGANRFFNVINLLNVQNVLTITSGSVFKKVNTTGGLYFGGNVTNNGSLFMASGTQVLLANFINGVQTATTFAQTISGSGTFYNTSSTSTATGSVNTMIFNNTSSQGVTLNFPNFRATSSITMTAGIIHVASGSTLFHGLPDVSTTASITGNFGNTCYIDGSYSKCIGSNQASTSLFLYPVGKSAYTPISLGVTGGGIFTAEAFITNSGNTTSNISNLSATRWKVDRVGTLGALTDFKVTLGSSALATNNLVVQATTDQGTYDNVFGNTATFAAATATAPKTITTPNATAGTSFTGNFAYATPPVCASVVPGNTIASVTTICGTQQVALSLQNTFTANGISFQWQIATGGTYSDISGATSATYTATPTVNSSYRCNVTCSNGPITASSTPIDITFTNNITSTTAASRCNAGTLTLGAAGSAGTVNWYAAATGGASLGTGTSFTTPSISTTTNYYVGTETTTTYTAGKSFSSTLTQTSPFTGLVFNAATNVRLTSVKVYPKQTAGAADAGANISIKLLDSNGIQVAGTSTVTFTPSTNTGTISTSISNVVTLNYDIPAGTGYRLVATNGLSSTNTLGRLTTTTYPVTLNGVSITAGSASLSTTDALYSNFFDWNVTDVCASPRVAVAATISGLPTVTTTNPAAVTQPNTVDLTAPAVTAGSTAGLTYSYFTDALATSTYATPATALSGTYYIVGTSALPGCTSLPKAVTATVYTPITEIQPSYWNTTLAALDTNITAVAYPGAQMYRFEVSNGATVIGTYDINSTNPYNFALAKIAGVTYGTTYSIRVALKLSDIWIAYGNSHNVTTPALSTATIQTTKINNTFCGTTLAALNTKIPASVILNATGYRFEITTAGITTVYDSSTYNFTLAQALVTVNYGTTYAIRVAAQINGIYGNYGASCNVTTPALTVAIIPTTTIQNSFCGATLATLSTSIGAIPVYAATGYRFEITTGGNTTIYDSSTYYFMLSQAGVTVAYGTTYSIRVAALVGGIYANYGTSCSITTQTLSAGTIPTTKVLSTFCGATLASLTTKIGAVPVYAATGYRFEIITGGVTTVYDSAVYNFTLAQAGVTVSYSTNYTIRVAVLVGGIYGNYGASCNVSTPVLTAAIIPTTTIQPSFCGNVLAALDTTISVVPIYGVTSGRYEITIAGGSPVVYEVAAYNFKLSQTGVAVLYDTNYAIRVAAKINGVWGNYGASCTITTPSAPAPARLKAKTFEISAYPNPFDTAFNLSLETPNKEDVTIAVYDMMGKLVETHQVNPMEVANLQIGNNFAAGIYNVIVSQANEMQAIRLIRK